MYFLLIISSIGKEMDESGSSMLSWSWSGIIEAFLKTDLVELITTY